MSVDAKERNLSLHSPSITVEFSISCNLKNYFFIAYPKSRFLHSPVYSAVIRTFLVILLQNFYRYVKIV